MDVVEGATERDGRCTRSRGRSNTDRLSLGGRAMQMKKLFKILVVGGSTLVVLAGAGCGGGSKPGDTSSQLNSDGGMDGGGVHGWEGCLQLAFYGAAGVPPVPAPPGPRPH